MSKKIILAIESSADETSVAIGIGNKQTKKITLASHIVYSQIQIHRKTDGIVPELAARAHLPKIIPTIKLALTQSKLELSDIDAIAVTAGPGLITSLMVGVDTAKALAFALNKPIIPANHLEGHLLSSLAGKNLQKRAFPALGLIVSGGHTLLVLVKSIGRYQILGQTLDDAAGECFDKVAKILGLPYPGGPELSRLAKQGNPYAIDFPRPMINKKNFNFSFAGLKTAVLYRTQDSKFIFQDSKADIAASLEQAIVDVLVSKTVSAAKKYRVRAVLLGGGVSANEKLRHTLKKEIKKNLTAEFLVPDSRYRTDNAGMIALASWYRLQQGFITTFDKVAANPNLPLISWQN